MIKLFKSSLLTTEIMLQIDCGDDKIDHVHLANWPSDEIVYHVTRTDSNRYLKKFQFEEQPSESLKALFEKIEVYI